MSRTLALHFADPSRTISCGALNRHAVVEIGSILFMIIIIISCFLLPFSRCANGAVLVRLDRFSVLCCNQLAEFLGNFILRQKNIYDSTVWLLLLLLFLNFCLCDFESWSGGLSCIFIQSFTTVLFLFLFLFLFFFFIFVIYRTSNCIMMRSLGGRKWWRMARLLVKRSVMEARWALHPMAVRMPKDHPIWLSMSSFKARCYVWFIRFAGETGHYSFKFHSYVLQFSVFQGQNPAQTNGFSPNHVDERP